MFTELLKSILLKHRVLITILIPLIFFILVFLFTISPSSNIPESTLLTPTPTKTATLEERVSRETENRVLEDPHEVINPREIPGFQKQELLPDGNTQYTISSSNTNRPDILIIDPDGHMNFKRSVTPSDKPLFLKDFIDVYGVARWVFKGSIFYGNDIRVHVYPDYGVALVVDPSNDSILEQHTFQKMKVEEYVRKYGDDIPANPEP